MTLSQYFSARVATALPPGSVRARLAHGGFWSLAGAVLSQAVGVVSTICIARILGLSTFGKYGMIQSTLGMFNIFAGLSLGQTANKFVAQFRDQDPERAGRIIGLSSLVGLISGSTMSLALLIFARPLAALTMNDPGLAPELRISCLMLLFGAVAGVQGGILAGFEAFRVGTLWNIVIAVLTAGMTVAGAFTGGLAGALWAGVAGAFLSLVLFRYILLQQCAAARVKPNYRGAWRERTILWSFTLPSVVSGMMVTPVVWAANAMLTRSPDGFLQLGILNAANQWRNTLLFLPSKMDVPLLTVMSQLFAAGEFKRLRRAFIRCMLLNLGLALAVGAVIALFSSFIMRQYGAMASAGVPVLLVSLAVGALLAVGLVVGQLIATIGAMWQGFLFNSIWAAILLGSAYMLVGGHGAMGLAGSYLIAYSVHTVVQLLYFFHKCRQFERQSGALPLAKDA